MKLLKIITLLLFIPVIGLGLLWGLFYQSFGAGIVLSEKILLDLITPENPL